MGGVEEKGAVEGSRGWEGMRARVVAQMNECSMGTGEWVLDGDRGVGA